MLSHQGKARSQRSNGNTYQIGIRISSSIPRLTDFFLFAILKIWFDGKKLSAVIEAISAYFAGLEKSYFSEWMKKLATRWINVTKLQTKIMLRYKIDFSQRSAFNLLFNQILQTTLVAVMLLLPNSLHFFSAIYCSSLSLK